MISVRSRGRAAGDLDIIGDADTSQLAAFPRFGAPGRKPVPIGERQRRIHRVFVAAAVVGDAKRIGVGLGRGRDHVPAAQRDRVEPQLVGGQIDQPLDDKDRLGPAGAAIRGGRDGIGDGAAAAEIADRDAIDARHQAEPFLQGHEGGRMPTEIAEVRAADGEEIPLLVESELSLDREIAALVIAEKCLAPLARPFHRPADPARGPGEQGVFGIEEVPRAEIAAHVPAHAAHLLGWHTQDLGEVEPQLGDAAAAAGIERVMPGRRIVFGRRGARLHRDAGDALHPSVEPNDVGGAPESRCGRRLVSNLDVDAEIIRRIIPQARGARLHRVGSPNYRRQRLIGDLEQLGRVLGLIDGLGHDHRDGLADKADLIGRHRVIAGRDRLEASNPHGHIGSAHEPCTVRDRREPVGDDSRGRSAPRARPGTRALLPCRRIRCAHEREASARSRHAPTPGRWTSSAKLPLPVRRRKSSLRRTG